MKTRCLMLVRIFLLVVGAMAAITPAWAVKPRPAPIQALANEGVKIVGSFEAPNGLTGYAATYHGQPVTVYVTPDGQHAVIGTMIDAQGHDLSAAPLKRLVSGPKYQKAWQRLKDSTWVADGSNNAPRVIYMFTDANCPYCHKLWKAARPWVKAGKLQIRHVLVGILRPSSLPKAAAILSSDDPGAALARDERNYDAGGVKPMSRVPADVAAKIKANNQLMKSLGLVATPAIFYRDARGQIAVKQGVPQGQELIDIMGSPKP